jgi:hypothetical protein
MHIDHIRYADAVANPDAYHSGQEGVLANGDVTTNHYCSTTMDLNGCATAYGYPVAKNKHAIAVDFYYNFRCNITVNPDLYGIAESQS